MKVTNFSEQNSVMNQYMAELRDKKYQQNRLLFVPAEPSAVS